MGANLLQFCFRNNNFHKSVATTNNIQYSKLEMHLWFSSLLECKTAIIQGVCKVMSILTEILESILYYKWRTFGTWSLDKSQVNHNVFPHFGSSILFDFNVYFPHPITLALWQILLKHKNVTLSLIRMESLTILHFTLYLLMMFKMSYALIQ